MTDSPIIRPLVCDDAESYVRLRLESLLDAPLCFGSSPGKDIASDPEWVRAQVAASPDVMLFGAFSPDLVGIAGLRRDHHLKASHKAHLWGMYVKPSHRRSGLALGLLRAAIAHASTLDGVDFIDLGVSSSAPEARRLYESVGFAAWGEEPDGLRHEGVTASAVHMSLRLKK